MEEREEKDEEEQEGEEQEKHEEKEEEEQVKCSFMVDIVPNAVISQNHII